MCFLSAVSCRCFFRLGCGSRGGGGVGGRGHPFLNLLGPDSSHHPQSPVNQQPGDLSHCVPSQRPSTWSACSTKQLTIPGSGGQSWGLQLALFYCVSPGDLLGGFHAENFDDSRWGRLFLIKILPGQGPIPYTRFYKCWQRQSVRTSATTILELF